MDNLTEQFNGPSSGILRTLRKIMNFIIILAGCIMSLTFFFVVILRYGFDADLFAYEEWLMVVAFWMFFMASAIATHDNVHINADILGIFLKNPTHAWLRTILVKTIELLILFYLCYLSYVMISEEIAAYPMWQMSIALKIPFLVPRLAIALGFFMMTIYTALYLYVLLKQGASCLSNNQQLVTEE